MMSWQMFSSFSQHVAHVVIIAWESKRAFFPWRIFVLFYNRKIYIFSRECWRRLENIKKTFDLKRDVTLTVVWTHKLDENSNMIRELSSQNWPWDVTYTFKCKNCPLYTSKKTLWWVTRFRRNHLCVGKFCFEQITQHSTTLLYYRWHAIMLLLVCVTIVQHARCSSSQNCWKWRDNFTRGELYNFDYAWAYG